jgi:hypothetical protein
MLNGENVYVIVTWLISQRYRELEMFMWMLHLVLIEVGNVYVNVTLIDWKDAHWGKCSCNCYMINKSKISRVGNVHVNVTLSIDWRDIAWGKCLSNCYMIYSKDIESGKCLCECYIDWLKRYWMWKMFM